MLLSPGDTVSTVNFKFTDDLSTYFNCTVQEIRSARQLLYQNVRWSLGFAQGVIIAAGYQLVTGGTELLSLGLLSFGLVVTLTFFHRTASALRDLKRWAAIRRRVLKDVSTKDENSEEGDNSNEKGHMLPSVIQYWDLKWRSPVSRATVVVETLFSMGFWYPFGSLFGLFIWTVCNLYLSASSVQTAACTAILMATIFVMALQISLFIKDIHFTPAKDESGQKLVIAEEENRKL